MNINVLSGIGPQGLVNFPSNSWMKRSGMKGLLVIITLIIGCYAANAQSDPSGRLRGMGGRGGKDSLQHRKDDTISITFRFLDSSRLQKIDSEVPQPDI
jgi:hypothetical protein